MALTTLVGKATPKKTAVNTVNTGTKSTIANSPTARRVMTSAGNNPGGLVGTKTNPFPTVRRGTRVGMTRGGPEPVGIRKTVARKPGSGTMRIIRGPRMATRVGAPKVALRNRETVNRIKEARSNLRTTEGRRVINPAGPRKIIKTQGRTKIIGKNKVIIVTKRGSVVRNKKTGSVVRARTTKGGKFIVRAKEGLNTKSTADDWTARKVKGANQARLVVRKGIGTKTTADDRTIRVSRNKKTPAKLRVSVRGPEGKLRMKKVIGPKYTKVTRGGKTTKTRTKYISAKQNEQTAGVGQKGWLRAGAKMKGKTLKPQVPVKGKPRLSGRPKRRTGETEAHYRNRLRHWKRVHSFRAKRRRRGARFNLSTTPTQLKNQAARNLA